MLGVINITPNSFSDGNYYSDLKTLQSTLINFKSIPGLAFDFGFESTAPMNISVSAAKERERFDTFFHNIKDIDLSGHWISFDTYKIENYLYFEEQFKSRYKNLGFIFNDVSGVIDSELISLLKERRLKENFFYIYCSSHIPSRDHVLDHMKFIKEGDIVEMCFETFNKGHEIFKEIGILEKIIFDPCFGFSKTYEQNWDLINRFDELVHKLKEQNIRVPWLIGVSRKSFLRKSLPHSIDPFNDSEILHEQIIRDILSKKVGHCLFRVHNPSIVLKSISL